MKILENAFRQSMEFKKVHSNKCETTCAKRFSASSLILDTKDFSVN